jgi:hypothetical protein
MVSPFDQLQTDLLIGTLLGDGCLQTENGQAWRYRAIHKAFHKQYIDHKYQILKDFCNKEPTYQTIFDSRTNKNYCRYYFNSRMSSDFRFLGSIFYKNDGTVLKKVVPKHIHRYLTPRALAYWYMDDGALKWKGHSNAVRFCTDSFSNSDVNLLINVLKEKYNLNCSLQKKDNIFRISILENSYIQLKDLVFPYLLPSMYYKFPDGNKGVINDEDISEDIRNTFRKRSI